MTAVCCDVMQGAIKFGEPLSWSQCVQLIGQLSRCQLPFQCAHGRPALVPLLDLQQITSAFAYSVSISAIYYTLLTSLTRNALILSGGRGIRLLWLWLWLRPGNRHRASGGSIC